MRPNDERGHLDATGFYYAHGFLGADLLGPFIGAHRFRLGQHETLPALPSAPPPTFTSAWGGLGSHVILAHHILGTVPAPLWQRFTAAVHAEPEGDFYRGIDGVPSVLAAVGHAQGASAVDLASFAHEHVASRLSDALHRFAHHRPVMLGLGHGLAGTLLAYETGCALLGIDGAPLRAACIEALLESAVEREQATHWPVETQQPALLHGVCAGAPGICIGALAGWRWSGDAAYEPLLQRSLRAVPVWSTEASFCCGLLGRVEALLEAARSLDDDHFLTLARSLYTRLVHTELGDSSWKDGRLGATFTELRFEALDLVDLPGLPMALPPLRP